MSFYILQKGCMCMRDKFWKKGAKIRTAEAIYRDVDAGKFDELYDKFSCEPSREDWLRRLQWIDDILSHKVWLKDWNCDMSIEEYREFVLSKLNGID